MRSPASVDAGFVFARGGPMRVTFVYPDVVTPVINFCPAVHVLSAVLKRSGHETALIHVNDGQGVPCDRSAIVQLARDQRPELIAMTATSFNYAYANEIAGWLEEAMPGVPRILGGAHATIQPEDFPASHFDAFCIGEGEEPLLDVVNALEHGRDWSDTPNLVARRPDGSIVRNPVRGFLRDLDALPFLDFDITETRRILEARQAWLSISFSRGCPYECTFCINHLYKQQLKGPHDRMSDYLRRRRAASAVDEMESLVQKFPGQIKVFNFDDDLLPMDKVWMREFAARYRRQILEPYAVKYAINCRATFLDEELSQLFARSGCHEVRIGFETGNERLREQVLGKPIRDADLIHAFAMCDRYGVPTNAFTMMGVPGESEDTLRDTVRMVLRLKPHLMRMTYLHPYAHTRIYDLCMERGLFKPSPVHEDSFTESPLRFEHLADEQIFCFRFLFPWYLNTAWYAGSPPAEHYRRLIGRFEHRSFAELRKSVPEIVECDKQASAQMDRPHFRYFGGNAYYFQLAGKYAPDGRVLAACEPEA